jgi:hypothetical protein
MCQPLKTGNKASTIGNHRGDRMKDVVFVFFELIVEVVGGECEPVYDLSYL